MDAVAPVTALDLGDLTLPAIWLRDACGCAECRHPATGQRLVGSARVARQFPDTAVARHELTGDTLTVVFAPDGHTGVYDLEWLRGNAPGRAGARAGDRSVRARVPWAAADLPAGPPRVAWDAWLRSPVALETALAAVTRLGVTMLTEVPCRPGMVLDVGRGFGYVRATNYGELFDVRIETNPGHLAYTGLALAPHTDNAYRDPVPTVQLLHCLRAAGEGGQTALIDGFAAATRLRERDPAAFDTLTTVWLPFRHDGPTAVLTSRAPVIAVDDHGAVVAVRWNDRSLQPPDVEPSRLNGVYRALAAFDELLEAPDLAVSLRLTPGDCLIFDNTRILHARTEFRADPNLDPDPGGAQGNGGAPGNSVGGRHLQGCYVDMDGLESTLALLRRDGARASRPRRSALPATVVATRKPSARAATAVAS